jgi:Bacterial regulatory helix-turn-helix protein, lysR family
MTMDLSNIPDLGSRQLLAVLAIADYGSFIAAAAFLKTSQPALTRTIKRIEDVLDVRLFERTTRRVQLTPARRSSRRPPGRTGEGPNRGSRSRNGCRRVGARKTIRESVGSNRRRPQNRMPVTGPPLVAG